MSVPVLQITDPKPTLKYYAQKSPLCSISFDLIAEIFMNVQLSQWPCLGQVCHRLHSVSKNLYLWNRKLAPVFPNTSLQHLEIDDLKQIVQLKVPASFNFTEYLEKVNQLTSIYRLSLAIYLDPEADPKLRVNYGKLNQVLSSCFPSFWALYCVSENKYIFECFSVNGLETVMKGGYTNFVFRRNEVLLTDHMMVKILQSSPPIPWRTSSLKESKYNEMRIVKYLVNHFTRAMTEARRL